jgi:hypothetical protein
MFILNSFWCVAYAYCQIHSPVDHANTFLLPYVSKIYLLLRRLKLVRLSEYGYAPIAFINALAVVVVSFLIT